MKILIIEDEQAGAEILKTSLKAVDASIEIIAICENEAQTHQALKTQPEIDAIFSDIQLSDDLSFNILKKIDENIPVVFVTAYNEYALEAFKHHGIDYVLKPFSKDDISKALQKLKTYKTGQSASNLEKFQNLLQYFDQQKYYKGSFLVNFKDRLIPLKTEEIVCFYTENTDIFALQITGKAYKMSDSLEQIEVVLNPGNFFRANRQFIVNKAFIEDIRHYFNGRLKLKLTKQTNSDILISKAKATEFKNWLSR